MEQLTVVSPCLYSGGWPRTQRPGSQALRHAVRPATMGLQVLAIYFLGDPGIIRPPSFGSYARRTPTKELVARDTPDSL